jgi:putative transposase
MANTYTSLYYHLVFATKRRERCLSVEVRRELWSYLGGIARNDGMIAFEVGGFFDHAHVLLSIPTRIAIAEAVKRLKGGSSPWIKSRFPGMHTFA